jgi:hypothetical protein
VYGTLGQPAPGNLPGGREYASSWTDSRGNLWLFGGEDAATHGTLNDLWKYQPAILAQATTTTVSSDANPASVGTTVTFTASVAVTSGSAIPTGSVDFTVDGSTALTAALDAAGQATYSTSALTAGPHTVAVNYAGATGFAASTSPDLTETIAIPVAAAPAFSPAAGSYTSAQAVTITSATTNATVYYTTDGSTPTTASTPYKDAINVSTTETLQAIAVAGGYSDSVVSTAAYAITLSNPTPVISNTDPAYTRAGGAGFAITVSGSGFTTGSTVYWGSIALTTQYVSDTRLTASITASEIANAGATAITVQSPAPGGGTSTAWQFEVDSASSTTTGPTLSSTTATVTAGAAASYPVTLPSTVSGVSITCLNLPAGATCSYSSSTHTVTIATSSTTLKGAYPVTLVITQTVTVTAAATILLPLLLPLVLMRKRLVARGAWFTACLGLVLLAAAAFSTGCGGGAKTPQTTTSTVKTSAVVDLIVQ